MVLCIQRVLKVRVLRISGFLKDRFTIARVRLHSDRPIAALQMCVICATSHTEKPPSKELVKLVLKAGTGSRMCVSHCVSLLMHRLNKTKSWIVALKCLTLIHQALQHGGFIYQDQFLSLNPRSGGKNLLNFSRFRDRSSPLAWEASSWIRWYAGFLETLIKASATPSIGHDLSSLQNDAVIAGILPLEALLREIGHCPLITDILQQGSHVLISDAFRLVVKDCITKHNELRIHMKEACERLDGLTVLQITELLRVYEIVNSERDTFVTLTEHAVSMNLLHPKACLDHRILKDDELMNIKAAIAEAVRVSKAAVAQMSRRKDASLGSFVSPLKLLPLGIWKSSEGR
ncbi:hypothetical protein GOP47_0002389 [Adiantum capillus-veneris]|uniref:ENTH domain-containing protein n=1 Tax=Adiantum capillus-veneris TaxID=13818 RepID=A0A9D4ZQX6_ADICA|nr:hypothetical protein GOP47_0002389 [Adiantum capillus-veneris]